MESGGVEQFWLESERTANVLKWLFAVGSVCQIWTEACVVFLREPKAFGVVVRLDPEPALRVCLVSQTMLQSYSTLFEVRACGWVEVQCTLWTPLSVPLHLNHCSLDKKTWWLCSQRFNGIDTVYDAFSSIWFQQCCFANLQYSTNIAKIQFIHQGLLSWVHLCYCCMGLGIWKCVIPKLER